MKLKEWKDYKQGSRAALAQFGKRTSPEMYDVCCVSNRRGNERSEDVRMFKKKRSIGLDYYGQGYIYFVCANYRRLPKVLRTRLDTIACSVGGFDEAALRKLLFDVTSSVRSVAMEYNLSEGKLNVLRDEFYKKAYRELTNK